MESPLLRPLLLAAIAFALAGSAQAQSSAPEASAAEPLNLYPERAKSLKVGGKAMLECVVNAKGELEGCKVLSETPSEFGFGEAALKVAKLMKMQPKTVDGEPVGGRRIIVPINFAPTK